MLDNALFRNSALPLDNENQEILENILLILDKGIMLDNLVI